MAMAIDSITYQHELNFSDYTTTSTTTTGSTTSSDQDHYALCDNWNDWSPVVDWEALSGPPDDFQGLIESIMDEDDSPIQRNQHQHQNQPCYSTEDEANNNINTMEDMVGVDQEEEEVEDTKGLRVVHLLMAAAEALTGMNRSRELARVILVRLKELVSPTDPTTIERLASYFTDALQSLLDGHSNPGKHHHILPPPPQNDPNQHQNDVLAAFQLLQDMSPYVKFGHFTANQAILEAVSQDRRIHIVDYDIMEGVQWAPLIQALATRKDGPPGPHLRITALSRPSSGGPRRSISTVQETGRRLAAFAASLGQPFSFHQCRLDPDESFRASALKLVRGEALVMNCMLHLPHLNTARSSESVASFLSAATTLGPRVVTVVEEEENGVGPAGFVSRFMESLHHYSAVCDSLEAGFPMQGRARALVERVFLGPRIAGSLAKMYRETVTAAGSSNKTAALGGRWWEWLGSAGFGTGSISFANHCQAKLLLGLFNDGYRVEELGGNRLVLGWKSRRLLSASVWTSPASPSVSDDSLLN